MGDSKNISPLNKAFSCEGFIKGIKKAGCVVRPFFMK